MLSIENPPPDPSCSSQVLAQLKTSSDEIDLLKKQSLDHHHHHHLQDTPLPKFSLRDYVFTARSKDIKKNWPFSPKNLQLCLKHGLKDPLPPFQSLDTVRNQSVERCVVETNPFEKQSTRKSGEEPSRSNDHVVVESSNDAHSKHNLPGTCVDNSSCRSGGEHGNDLPSTTASVSQSDIDLVLVNKQSKLPLETDTSVEASVEVRAAGKTRKSENTNRPSGKKCRLFVKFGAHSDRSSTEDITSNSTMLSESMASKVCPVCKTFSSSSNTTLNAHIDQCLSDESTPKWTVDSKLTRHRIKPRKTRLMVDVYTTAKPCTLEELDRRNGTSWATNIPRQDSGGLEISDEGKKQSVSRSTPENTGDVGAVYVDANGTKIRILSKSNDVPQVSKDGDDPGPSKALKGSKASKFLSTKRKKHGSKHHKYLKLASQSPKLFSQKTRSSMIGGGQEGYRGVAESCKSEGPHVPKKIKSSDSRSFKERLCSEQAVFSRKPNNQDRHPPSICKQHVTEDLQVQSNESHRGDLVVERNIVHKLKSSSGNPFSSPEKYEKTVKPVYEAPDMDGREHSFGRKRVRSSLCGPRTCNKLELRPLKRNANQLSEDRPRLDKDCMMRSMNSSGNYSSSWSKKVIDIDANSNLDTPVTATTPSSDCSYAFKGFRYSPKKNVSSASRSSMVKSGSKNHLTTASQLHFMEEIDEEEVSWGPESDQECELLHDGDKNQRGRKEITEEMSFGGSSIQGVRFREQRGRKTISRRDESMALKSIHLAPHCYGSDETENSDSDSDSSARGSEDILDKVDCLESIEETVTSLSQSVETKFNKLSNLSKNRSNSLQTNEDYSGPLCGGEGLTDLIEPSLGGKPHMFCGEVSHGIIGQTADMGGEPDSDVAQLNSFPEVDPIPIPGPPGSFLPSPRDMGSDDFQGNSSLDTARIDSQDQLDMVDGDSSDSPISAVSTISSSVEAKSDLKQPLAFEGAPAVLKNYRSGYSTAKYEPLAENGAAFPHTSAGLERTFEGENFRVHRMSFEKRPMMFTNDDQPCCCQRKDRSSQGFALTYKEPQLLRQRTMPSMMVPVMGMQIAANQNIGPDNFDARPEANSLSSTASLGSEQMVLPVMKPPASGAIAFKGFSDAGVKLSARSDCESATPSSSNPVLRLMGKNLMVVNKEEDASVPHDQAQSSSQGNRLTPNFPTSGISPGNIPNQGGMPFQHTMPQSSLIFDQHPRDFMGRGFDVQLTNGYRNRANLGTPQTPAQLPAGMFSDELMNCGLTTSKELYKYEGDYNLLARPNRPKNKPGPAAAYDIEKVAAVDSRYRNGDSAVSSKEVIVIDDAPEGLRENPLIPAGISMPLASNHSVRYRNPFSRYQSENSLLGGANFNATPSVRANTVPVRWDCSSEGSGVPQRAPLMDVSPSRGHLRPAVYYPPSFS